MTQRALNGIGVDLIAKSAMTAMVQLQPKTGTLGIIIGISHAILTQLPMEMDGDAQKLLTIGSAAVALMVAVNFYTIATTTATVIYLILANVLGCGTYTTYWPEGVRCSVSYNGVSFTINSITGCRDGYVQSGKCTS